jgi:hypothetical protein
MKENYQVLRPEVERAMRRRISIAEINMLRKYEGKSLIEEKIARQMSKLHDIWFGARK